MGHQIETFLTARDDLARTDWRSEPGVPLEPGQILATVDRFALTANNVTYARTGDRFGYWDFFPAAPPFGAVPVWALATVRRSRCDTLSEGEKIYGFFPMATHLVLRPARVRPRGFVDATLHRATLAATYNEYSRVDHDPDYDPAQADNHLVLRPLFALAFFLHAYLQEHAFFGASTVLISSASSKASLTLATMLADAPVCVVGLTSRSNASFVAASRCYEQVAAYDEIGTLGRDGRAVYLDIAGNSDVLASVHANFGDRLCRSISAGFTHGMPEKPRALPGPNPELFFTPSHILALRERWGADVLRARLAGARAKVFPKVGALLHMRRADGRAAVSDAWTRVLSGQTPPQDSWLLSVTPRAP